MVELPSSKTCEAYCQKTLTLFQTQVTDAKVQGSLNLPPLSEEVVGDQPTAEAKLLDDDEIRPLLTEELKEKGYTINATEDEVQGSFVDVNHGSIMSI